MSQEIATAVSTDHATQSDWLKGALSKNPSRSRGVHGHGGAAALATQWKSTLRPASVPLLPAPNFGPVRPAQPATFAATSDVTATVEAIPPPPARQPSPTGDAVAVTSASRPAVQSAGLHNVVVAVLSLILVLLVLYLIAGPFGDSVSILRPFHQLLAGLLSHRSQ